MTTVIELTTENGRIVAREVPSHRPQRFRLAGAVVRAALRVDDGTGFNTRVTERRVDLFKHIEGGIPPLEYLAASEGMLIKGKRHLIPGPKKSGKTISMLVHGVVMALAGARVIIFDRENGASEYASRLSDITSEWGLTPAQTKKVQRNLTYFAFPHFKPGDGPDLVKLAQTADVVVFDSTRMFLTDLSLKEDSTDDYATFMYHLIDPLFSANVATVVLDNTGHSNTTRARGASGKGDLNEVLFTFDKVEQFSLTRKGKVKLTIADSRFGNEGEWYMTIGGGAFEPWSRFDGNASTVDPAFREAAENALQAAGLVGLSSTKLIEEIRKSYPIRHAKARSWLNALADSSTASISMTKPDKKGLPATFYGGNSGE
jgi:hypothetical protein